MSCEPHTFLTDQLHDHDSIAGYRGGSAGPHKIDGVGVGGLAPPWDPARVDEVIVAPRLGAGATVVTLMCDSGLTYLSTDVFGSA